MARMILMKDEKKETSLIKYRAKELTIKFPDNKYLTDKEKEKTRNAIKKGGIVKNDGKTFINKNKMPTLLATDKKGANKVYNDLDNDEKFQDGKLKYADSVAIVKEISKRIQEPRTQLERENLKDRRDCINAFIDSPDLEKERSIEADRIKKGLSNLTKKKMKAENITRDQLTGEAFNKDAEGHHKVRKADDPRKALDQSNIIVTKKENHDKIHQQGAEDIESLRKLAQKEGWNTENI